jgi:hypothetical protein
MCAGCPSAETIARIQKMMREQKPAPVSPQLAPEVIVASGAITDEGLDILRRRYTVEAIGDAYKVTFKASRQAQVKEERDRILQIIEGNLPSDARERHQKGIERAQAVRMLG